MKVLVFMACWLAAGVVVAFVVGLLVYKEEEPIDGAPAGVRDFPALTRGGAIGSAPDS